MNKYAIPVLHVSMPTRVYEYVRDTPRCTSRDIAADLDMCPQTVRMALKRMQNKRMIKTCGLDPVNNLVFWVVQDVELLHRVERFSAPKQETVSSWPALTIPKQNIFSALGL